MGEIVTVLPFLAGNGASAVNKLIKRAVKPDSYRATAEKWSKLYIVETRLRSRHEIERLLRKLVFPHWGERDFVSIKRKDCESASNRDPLMTLAQMPDQQSF